MRTFVRAMRPVLATLLVAWFSCAFPAAAASKGAAPNKDIVVVSYVANNPTGSTPYNIQGDGRNNTSSAWNGLLSGYYNNVDSVTSILNANTYNQMPVGDWQLTTLSSPVRTVQIDLSGQAVTPPSDLHGAMPARLIEDCTKIKLDITQMVAGGSDIQCPAWFRFNTSNSNLYYGLSLDVAVGTTYVSISCKSNGGNGYCNYWTVDPPAGGAVGQLQQLTSVKGGTHTSVLGNFNLIFHFEIDERQSNP